jgi:hypothetical protein
LYQHSTFVKNNAQAPTLMSHSRCVHFPLGNEHSGNGSKKFNIDILKKNKLYPNNLESWDFGTA